MNSWVSPQILLWFAGSLLAGGLAWGDLRARVKNQAERHSAERTELRNDQQKLKVELAERYERERSEILKQIDDLRTDLDLIRTRNGSPRVMAEIAALEKRADDADVRALKWIPVITALEARYEVLTRQPQPKASR